MSLDARATLDALRRGDLAGARTLRLCGGLTAFPREILGLADTLEVLDLSGNALTDLPADLGRLSRLRVLFLSGNPLDRLPPALGACPALSQIGCRGSGVREVPGEALPPRLRWLTLTDNRIAALPEAIAERPALQKLLLAGNRLRALPARLGAAPGLELIRISANRFEALPGWLGAMPALAWPSWAGNPCERVIPESAAPDVSWDDLVVGPLLGEGASGRVHRATWRTGGAAPVALKLFKGAMTSDGLPERETAACLAAGAHPGLAGALGRVVGSPEGAMGLLMPLLPDGWHVLAAPPSLESCSRDVYPPGFRLAPGTVLRIAAGVASALAHLHGTGLLHGDVYGHNVLWDGFAGQACLTDLGAASALPEGAAGPALRRVDTRAFGLLLGELLDRCDAPPAGLRALERACVQPDVTARPLMADAAAALASLPEPDQTPDSVASTLAK